MSPSPMPAQWPSCEAGERVSQPNARAIGLLDVLRAFETRRLANMSSGPTPADLERQVQRDAAGAGRGRDLGGERVGPLQTLDVDDQVAGEELPSTPGTRLAPH